MDYTQLFQWANLLILPGWLLLLLAPRWRWTQTLVIGGNYSAAYALLYLVLMVRVWGEVAMDFSSLATVQTLFQHPGVLLAGWVHYLAFDLFVGGWMLQDSQRHGIRHYWMVPVLLLTFYLGPLGLLLYRGARALPIPRG